MKQNKTVKSAGPYHVISHSQGTGIVSLSVFPAFPEYDNDDFKWAESRFNQDGGGPGIFSAIATAEQLEAFLNSVYTPEQIQEWKDRIKAILKKRDENTVMVECETCATVSGMPKECKYCPVCGNKYKVTN